MMNSMEMFANYSPPLSSMNLQGIAMTGMNMNPLPSPAPWSQQGSYGGGYDANDHDTLDMEPAAFPPQEDASLFGDYQSVTISIQPPKKVSPGERLLVIHVESDTIHGLVDQLMRANMFDKCYQFHYDFLLESLQKCNGSPGKKIVEHRAIHSKLHTNQSQKYTSVYYLYFKKMIWTDGNANRMRFVLETHWGKK